MISRRRALSLTLCSTLALGVSNAGADAASADAIDADVDATLRKFTARIRGARELLAKAAAVLVFPSVVKAGIGIGGEYGEGALRVHGRTVDYFNTVSASIGFQLGVQARSVIIAFMTHEAFDSFRRVHGWKVGVDGSVALITLGAGGSIELEQAREPDRGLHLRRQGPDVQSDARGLEDQPRNLALKHVGSSYARPTYANPTRRARRSRAQSCARICATLRPSPAG